MSNVIQEKLVKHNDREEYLGMLGTFGSLLAAVQICIMETKALSHVEWTGQCVGFIIGFIVCLNLMYSRASLFLRDCDAALLNLSLLTSDVYAVVFSFLCYGYLVSWLYFVAFGLAFIGIWMYSTAGSPTPPADDISVSFGFKDNNGDDTNTMTTVTGLSDTTNNISSTSEALSSALFQGSPTNSVYPRYYESYHSLPSSDKEGSYSKIDI